MLTARTSLRRCCRAGAVRARAAPPFPGPALRSYALVQPVGQPRHQRTYNLARHELDAVDACWQTIVKVRAAHIYLAVKADFGVFLDLISVRNAADEQQTTD